MGLLVTGDPVVELAKARLRTIRFGALIYGTGPRGFSIDTAIELPGLGGWESFRSFFQPRRTGGWNPFSGAPLDHSWILSDTRSEMFNVLMQRTLEFGEDACMSVVVL